MTTWVGQTLGGYAVLEQLGAGGMGAVFKARQPVLDRIVALKVIAPQVAQDSSFIARFQQEAKSAARLNHPNIVQVYAAGEEGDTHFMVTEFVEGESLQQRLNREGRMDPQEALAICVFVAEGLKHAWDEAQIIHRDIKPANIFLSNKGAVKVGDLGLAKSVASDAGSALTQSGMMMGTPYYCSPEQAQAEKDLDFRADIYSLGCTLYHMLSGKRPYEAGPDQSAMSIMVKQIHEPPPAILQVFPTCPMPVVLLLGKMLAKQPSARHQSYDELLDDLRRVHDQLGQPQPAAPVRSPPASAVAENKSSVVVCATAAVVAVLLSAGVFVWAPWKERRAGTQPTPPRETPAQRRQDAGGTPTPAVERKPEQKEEMKTGLESRLQAEAVSAQPAKAGIPNAEALPSKPPEKKPEPVAETVKPDVPLAPSATMTAVTAVVEQKVIAPAPKTEDVFVKDVAALPPEQQVTRVMARLKELNPQFDGKETHKVEAGTVTDLTFSTVGVTDITPLRALKWLKKLVIAPTALNQKGALADLGPLQGLPLTWLWCHNNSITDLAPLRGMALTTLSFSGTQVGDLSPLSGMKLSVLSFSDTPVRDLAPLADMPLTVLWCNNTQVTDLSPLKAMPLQELKCDFAPARDAATVRGIATLQRINDMAARAFWMRFPTVAGSAGWPLASGKPIVLKARELDGGFDFSDTSAPYEIQGALAVPTTEDGHLLEAQKITVAAGVEIRGGILDINRRGQLSIEGAPGKPAVFRSVTFAQNLNAHGFKARHAVFDRCKFMKTGGWVSYSSSKWELDACLLYKCTFASLNGVNYGLKFSNSAFVGMSFPELEHRREKGKPFDHMKHLRAKWNKIVRCQFVNCEIPPTLVWCAEESNHFGCRFVVGEAFESQDRTTVTAFVADTVGKTPDAATLIAPTAKAGVVFNYVRQPFSTYPQATPCPLADVARDMKLMNWLSSRPASPFTVLTGVKTVSGTKTGL